MNYFTNGAPYSYACRANHGAHTTALLVCSALLCRGKAKKLASLSCLAQACFLRELAAGSATSVWSHMYARRKRPFHLARGRFRLRRLKGQTGTGYRCSEFNLDQLESSRSLSRNTPQAIVLVGSQRHTVLFIIIIQPSQSLLLSLQLAEQSNP